MWDIFLWQGKQCLTPGQGTWVTSQGLGAGEGGTDDGGFTLPLYAHESFAAPSKEGIRFNNLPLGLERIPHSPTSVVDQTVPSLEADEMDDSDSRH